MRVVALALTVIVWALLVGGSLETAWLNMACRCCKGEARGYMIRGAETHH